MPKLNLFKDVKFIPISALEGDNVVTFSDRTPWYEGPTLLGHIESVHIASDWNLNGLRFPVQWVNRPNNPTDPALHDFRGLSGQIAGGIVKVGQEVLVLSGKRRIRKSGPTTDRLRSLCPQSVTLRWRTISTSAAAIPSSVSTLAGHSAELAGRVCWMNPRPLTARKNISLSTAHKPCSHGDQSRERLISKHSNRRKPPNWL